MTRTVLIDGDILKYSMGWSVQKEHWTPKFGGKETIIGKMNAKKWFKEHYPDKDFNEEDWSSETVLDSWEECANRLDNRIEELIYKTKADEALVCLSPKECFRDRAATVRPYKGNRKPNRPEYADKIIEHFNAHYDVKVGEDVEADDVMGMLQTTNNVIASTDKDLLMIPGRNYNWTTEKKTLVTPDMADKQFFIQLIMGDSVDNIVGLPQYGEKAASAIVESYQGDNKELVKEIADLYEEHYPGEGREVMYEMAALVWILRKGETPETAGWRRLLNENL